MPLDTFNNIHHLPDPIPSEDGHYTPFSEVYGSSTTEQHRPSMQVKRAKQRTLPFSASIQHVKNVSIIIQCEECQKWRLLYCKRKLTTSERCELLHILDTVTYTCGAQLEDLVDIDKQFDDVFCRQIRCNEQMVKLYYSVGEYETVCIHCGGEESLEERQGYYPQCRDCDNKQHVIRRR